MFLFFHSTHEAVEEARFLVAVTKKKSTEESEGWYRIIYSSTTGVKQADSQMSYFCTHARRRGQGALGAPPGCRLQCCAMRENISVADVLHATASRYLSTRHIGTEPRRIDVEQAR